MINLIPLYEKFLLLLPCLKIKKSWCSSGILNSCRTKNKLYRKYVNNRTDENKTIYTRFKNRLTTVIRIAKFNYYQREFNNQSVRGTLDAINSILHGCNRNASRSVEELNENGQNICDLDNICNVFNDHFVNIGNILSSNTDNISKRSFREFLSPSNEHCMFLNPTDEVEVIGCIYWKAQEFQSWS